MARSPTCCPRPRRRRRARSRRRSARRRRTAADAVVCINLSVRALGHHAVGPERGRAPSRATSTCGSSTRGRSPPGSAPRCVAAAEAAPTARPADEVVALVEDLRRPHPRLRRPRHAREPQEGRPHRRRPGAARHDAVDQAAHRHQHRRGRGGGQGSAPARRRWRWLRDKAFSEPATVEHLSVCHGDGARPRRVPRPARAALPARRRSASATIGPVIGTHGGPRVIGVTWLDPA